MVAGTLQGLLTGCSKKWSLVRAGCSADHFAEASACYSKVVELARQAQSKLTGNLSAMDEGTKSSLEDTVARADQEVRRLEAEGKQGGELEAWQCKPAPARWRFGLQVFLVDSRKYTPIQGNVEFPGRPGFGLSSRIDIDSIHYVHRPHLWLDYSFLFEWQSIPLKSRTFGTSGDVTFNEDLRWMIVAPLGVGLALRRPFGQGDGWADHAFLRLMAGPVIIRSTLDQGMSSNYTKIENGKSTSASDNIGSLSVGLFTAFGYHAEGEGFLPFIGSFGLRLAASLDDIPSISFENPSGISHKVTFDDLRRNGSYRFYRAGAYLAVIDSGWGSYQAGYQEAIIDGANGSGISNRNVLLQIAGAF